MPSLRAYLRGVFGRRREERQREARYAVGLIVGITLSSGEAQRQSYMGLTRSLSASGLSFMIESISADAAALLGPGYRFFILLSLPTGTIRLQATGMYVRPVKEQQSERGWLCGARITEIEAGQRNLFTEYLNKFTD